MLFILIGLAIGLFPIIHFTVPNSTDDLKFALQAFAATFASIAVLSLIVTLSVFAYNRIVDIPKEYREVVKQLKSLDSEKSKELKENFLEHIYSHNDNASFWIAGFGKTDPEKYTFQDQEY